MGYASSSPLVGAMPSECGDTDIQIEGVPGPGASGASGTSHGDHIFETVDLPHPTRDKCEVVWTLPSHVGFEIVD